MSGVGAIALAGCTIGDDSQQEPDTDDTSGTTDQSDTGGNQMDPEDIEPGEFVASVGANPGTFDPTIITDAASNAVVGTMSYDSLLSATFDLSEFRGELATDWEQVDDTTFRFTLREGVQFHNGDEFVADDVAFSINRMSGTTNDAVVAWIDNVEILGDYEIEITAAQPHAPFLVDISGVPILPHDADASISETPQDDDHRFDEETLGTGPFVLEEFSPEDRVVLSSFDDFWFDGEDYPGTAPWDTVTFRVIPEQVSQEEAMAAGELDMIDNPAPFDLGQWENQTGTVVNDVAVGYDFIAYPAEVPPYNNPKFRRGMTRLIPRSEIAEAIFGGLATEIGGPISPGLGAYWDPEHEQRLLDEYVGEDVEEGTRLIEEALEEEGIEPPLDVAFITNVNRTRERWMEVIQQTMDETEFFNAELDVRAFDDLVAFLLDPEGAAQSQNVVGIGWTGGSGPDGHCYELIHSSGHVPNGFNWTLYENEEVDSLLEEGRRTLDVDARREVYFELQELLAQEVPLAYMWTSDAIGVVNPDSLDAVDDWQPHPNASFRYNTLYSPHLDQMAIPPQ